MAGFIAGNRAKFKWRQMIVTADWVSSAMPDDAVAAATSPARRAAAWYRQPGNLEEAGCHATAAGSPPKPMR